MWAFLTRPFFIIVYIIVGASNSPFTIFSLHHLLASLSSCFTIFSLHHLPASPSSTFLIISCTTSLHAVTHCSLPLTSSMTVAAAVLFAAFDSFSFAPHFLRTLPNYLAQVHRLCFARMTTHVLINPTQLSAPHSLLVCELLHREVWLLQWLVWDGWKSCIESTWSSKNTYKIDTDAEEIYCRLIKGIQACLIQHCCSETGRIWNEKTTAQSGQQ